MLAAVRSATLIGVDGQPVTVEVHVSSGLPAYQVVGLPDAAVPRVARARRAPRCCRRACRGRRTASPSTSRPAGVRKTGSGLELAVALGVLGANDALPAGVLDGVAVLGELGLDGSVRPVPGTLALVDALAREPGWSRVVVPIANASEAELVGGVRVRAARTLGELRACLKGEEPWPDWDPPVAPTPTTAAAGISTTSWSTSPTCAGCRSPAQALEVAAAGGHHLLFCGPPGTGKTMLARRLRHDPARRSTHAEALEVTRIHSAAGDAVARPPRRAGGRSAPRTTPRRPPRSSAAAAVAPDPGEITLAHRGVLFLDELGEFAPSCARRAAPTARGTARCASPARACRSRSPPRSSWWRARTRARAARARNECRCSDAQRERYRRRLSAPLLDRFDLRVRVDAPESRRRRRRVVGRGGARGSRVAYERQRARYADWPWSQNAHVAAGAVPRLLPLGADADEVWRDAHRRPQPHRSRRHPDPTRRAHARRPRRQRRASPPTTSSRRAVMRGDVP